MPTIIRRRFNRIDALRDHDDLWCIDEATVKRLVVEHSRDLVSVEDTGLSLSSSSTSSFPILPAHFLQELEKLFSSFDIQLALKAMQPFKAPGLDGFHALFFQRY